MKFSTEQFTYDKKDNKFIAEISDLETEGQNVFGSIPDHSGQGLILVSQWTGEESNWWVMGVEHSNDEDNELQAWHLIPSQKSQKRFPKLRTASMVIFND